MTLTLSLWSSREIQFCQGKHIYKRDKSCAYLGQGRWKEERLESRRIDVFCVDTMGAKIYWAINWLGVFCNCNYLYYIYIVLCVWAVFFVPEFSCSLRPESFLPEFLFPLADTIQCFAFLPERNVFMRLPPALWTTTIVSLFSTHLNKCKALYIEIIFLREQTEWERCDVNAISAANVTQWAPRLPFEKSCACGWKSSYQAVE